METVEHPANAVLLRSAGGDTGTHRVEAAAPSLGALAALGRIAGACLVPGPATGTICDCCGNAPARGFRRERTGRLKPQPRMDRRRWCCAARPGQDGDAADSA